MELMQRFAAGDLDAFEALFRQHQKEVYSWIVRIVRDHGIADTVHAHDSTPMATSVAGRAASPPTPLSTTCGPRGGKRNFRKVLPPRLAAIRQFNAKRGSGSALPSTSFLQSIVWWPRSL